MMIKTLLSTVGISLIVFSGNVMADDNYVSTCESWGYKTNLRDCTIGLPLICPYSNNDASQQPKCLCLDNSCRGFSLLEEDLDELASDGRKVRDHIESLETCESGIGADKVTYYRIKKCKKESLYQIQNTKPTCDVGCPTDRYPYSEHPGDLAGVVESCVDEKGTWFGYLSCNEGWVKGGAAGHECIFNDCNVRTYPYSYDPNTIQQRGTTKYCKVGGNNYYQYSSCDEEFTPKGGICQSKCYLKDCEVTSTDDGYNHWSCGVEDNLNCQAGDAAYLDGFYLGVIGYQPNGSGETLIIGTETNNSITPFAGKAYTNNYGSIYSFSNDMNNGKKSTVKYINRIKSDSNFSYPAIEACYAYSSPMCSHEMCRAGEWFLGGFYEVKNTYPNRYILYNVTSKETFLNKGVQTVYSDNGNHWYVFDYSTGSSKLVGRLDLYASFPILSYTQK